MKDFPSLPLVSIIMVPNYLVGGEVTGGKVACHNMGIGSVTACQRDKKTKPKQFKIKNQN